MNKNMYMLPLNRMLKYVSFSPNHYGQLFFPTFYNLFPLNIFHCNFLLDIQHNI